MTDLTIRASNGSFWCAQNWDMSSSTASSYEERVLSNMQSAASGTGHIFTKSTDGDQKSGTSVSGRGNLYRRYQKAIILGDYRLPSSNSRSYTLYVDNLESSDYVTVFTASAHNPSSSNTDNTYYYLRSSVMGLINGPGSYIDYVISTSSSTYPSNGEHTDGYWYTRR